MSLLAKFSLKNPVAILLLILLVISGGIYSSTRFQEESMPDISIPYLFVTAVYPGSTPQESQNEVAIPLANALKHIPGVKTVMTNSASGVATISLEFGFDADMDEKKDEIEEAIAAVKLPAQVERPTVSKISFSSGPMMYLSVTAEKGADMNDLQEIVAGKIVPALQGLDGVGKVQTLGLLSDNVFIRLDAAKMRAAGISYGQVSQVLQAMNVSIPAGVASFGDMRVPVMVTGRMTDINELKRLVINPQPLVRLADIADVRVGADAPETISRVQGEPSVAVNIIKNNDANAVDVSDAVMSELQRILKNNKEVKLDVIYDAAKDIKKSVNGSLREGLLGALFASLLILVFLRNFRATLIAIVSIPLSIFAALILLKQFTNVTLNIITLGGVAVAIGRVVDDSIVVIENIVRRLQGQKVTKELVKDATGEVAAAITSSTITTVAVFAPLGLVGGIIGKVFAPFALTVVFSILASLVVAVTVVPTLAYLLLKRVRIKEHAETRLKKSYKRLLGWSLNHKLAVLLLSLVLLGGSYPLIKIAGVTFIPEQPEKYIMMNLKMPTGTDLLEVDALARKMDEKLRETGEVALSQVTVGQPQGEFDPVSMTAGVSNVATWIAQLYPDTEVDRFIRQLKEMYRDDLRDTDSTMNIQEVSVGPAGPGINIIVTGQTRQDINQATEAITAAVKQIEGTENVSNTLLEKQKTVEIRIRPADALKYGMTTVQAAAAIRPLLSAQTIGTFGNGTKASDLILSVTGLGLNSAAAISEQMIVTPVGQPVAVGAIADVTEKEVQSVLQLRDGEDYAMVTGGISAQDSGAVNSRLKEKLSTLKLPEGTQYILEGSDKQIADMMSDMQMAMAVAVALVYIVMIIAFGNGRAPLSVLFSLPFAVIGAFAGTVIARQPISVASMIGMLMLIGIVVTNAIVLVDRVQQRIREGAIIREALLEAGGTRLRPILMTAIATICALLPLALGLGEGALISTGLAVVVIGGLVTSTLLTLIVVPVMYELLYYFKAKREIKRAQRLGRRS
ncbi:MAG TPA: efflux RND transporter permease subunit [Bacilli bacterium]